VIMPGAAQSERAASYLAAEAACFANSDGGGALLVGVADDGQLIGTDLSAEWLRYRIYQLTNNRLTVDVREATIGTARLLVLRIPEALEPIAVRGRITWRVADNCVEVDAGTWMSGRLHRLGVDWSAAPSGHEVREARAAALEQARDLLRASRDPRADELAAVSDEQLLSRLDAIATGGFLTNAGALLFIGRGEPALDYRRRDVAGGDSVRRVHLRGRSLLEELAAVEGALDAYNPITHLRTGLVEGQLAALPPTAAREALVNGIAHRDWVSSEPVTVEHVGNVLVVSSPGGFIGGVTSDNIITHPSQSRNRRLADILSELHLAEREGIGVDRMVRDMIRFGHSAPAITEEAGPRVRVALVGSAPDRDWLDFLDRLSPREAGSDLDVLLLLNRLTSHGWIDLAIAARVLQKSHTEAEDALGRLERVRYDRQPLIRAIPVGFGTEAAYRLSDAAREELADRLNNWLPTGARPALILDWARTRGRVSTTEIADIVGTTVARISTLLQSLEGDGHLVAGRENRSGRGFFYRLAD
jgi:ATP-dependent DNA helicase RecG